MTNDSGRQNALKMAIHRQERVVQAPCDASGKELKVSEYFGENIFDVYATKLLPQDVKNELKVIATTGMSLTKEIAEKVAKAVSEWAMDKGATHFTHWFQPLTGSTAEKHDAFLSFDGEIAIETLSADQLMRGEPDASSFPHGGMRSTFEARGYTCWDITSPMFLIESPNGKTLFIPTAFICYHGGALDLKTPLLRSSRKLGDEAAEFLRLAGDETVKSVGVNVGAEQEYFLVDKSFYFLRPDLVMTGRTLFGALTPRNQQLEDHYFGSISDRVLGFMQEFEIELYRLGIPAKTRHNEVAPGQFEIAPIFSKANLASDHNQLIMNLIKKVALKHDLVALIKEKPFLNMNGSGKHLNWSMSDDKNNNLLSPGKKPEENFKFLAVVSVVLEAVCRRSDILRLAISSHSNDYRLGGHEAPPSIISIFLGDTVNRIFESLNGGAKFQPEAERQIDGGAPELAESAEDNTDRNRTSPFAFTGNRFEFRAVGSSAAIGFPISVLNAAVSEVFHEANEFMREKIGAGMDRNQALKELTLFNYKRSKNIIFNGDGYGAKWTEEAAKRGLPNLKNTVEAITFFRNNEERSSFLVEQEIFSRKEFSTYYNVILERYNKYRIIEMKTLISMVDQYILPASLEFKQELAQSMTTLKTVGSSTETEGEILKNLSEITSSLHTKKTLLQKQLHKHEAVEDHLLAETIVKELLPLFEEISLKCSLLEEMVPNARWELAKYIELLFIK